MRKRIQSILESDFKGADLSDALKGLLEVENGLVSSFPDGAPELAERIQAAILKVANKNIDRLNDALVTARSDWRDLLVGAVFSEDENDHKRWIKERMLSKPIKRC